MKRKFVLKKKDKSTCKKKGEIETTYKYTYECVTVPEIQIKVKGESAAKNNGFPVGAVDDVVFIDIGATNTQSALDEEYSHDPKDHLGDGLFDDKETVEEEPEGDNASE